MTSTTRMLLSHNCTLPADFVRELNRSDFANVFIKGLEPYANIQCSLIENPHWIVEIIFDQQETSPTNIAKLCAQVLGNSRLKEKSDNYTIMFLGGLKKTPQIGNSPTSLKPGEWGVDVVETVAPEDFLAGINWETLTKDKAPEDIFKLSHEVGFS